MTDNEDSQEDAAVEQFSAVVLGGLAAPLLIVMRGLVLVQLWAWFLTPLGLPAIGVAQAIGIAVLITVLVPRDSASAPPKNASELLKYLSPKAAKLLASLLLGAAAYAFVP